MEIVIGLSSAFLIAVVMVVTIAPKILCRHCHDHKEGRNAEGDAHEYEDEVVYGEVRYPIEIGTTHNTSLSNPLYPKCIENSPPAEGNTCKCVESVASCEREVSHTPDLPLHYDSDNDSIIKKCDSKQSITMTQDPSYRLKRNFITAEADNLNCTELVPICKQEASHVHASLPHNDSSNNGNVMMSHSGLTMNLNPPHRLERTNFYTKAENLNSIESLPACRRESDHIPPVPPCSNNKESIIKRSDSEQSIIMTQNPSYNLKSNFSTESDNLNCTKLVRIPICDRKANHICAILPYSNSGDNGINRKFHSGQNKTTTLNPPHHLERNFSRETDNFSSIELLPTCTGESGHIPTIPPCNNNNNGNIIRKSDSEQSIIMTQNPSYQLEKDFFEQ